MPAKSTNKRPRLKDDETKYVDYLHSPEGRAAESEFVRESRKKPVVYVDEKLTPSELAALGERSRARVVLNNGIGAKPNRPNLVEELIARVEAQKTKTEMIALRMDVSDLELARRIAEDTGIGYQTIIKDILHEGLQRLGASLPSRSQGSE